MWLCLLIPVYDPTPLVIHALSTDLHATTRTIIRFFALNIALTSVSSIHNIQNCCLQAGKLMGFLTEN